MPDTVLAEAKRPAVSRPGNPALSWYVAYTKPCREQMAVEQLERQGYRVYLPLVKILKIPSRKETFEPMFPRYAFFAPGAAGQSVAPARSTVGVSSVVRFGDRPAVMPEATLGDIRAFEAAQHRASFETLAGLTPGCEVQVVNGPLAGLEGLVSEVGEERIMVLLRLLGREVKIGMGATQLKIAL